MYIVRYCYFNRSQPTGDALRLLVSGRAAEICALDADNILIMPEGVKMDATQVKSLFCDANITVFMAELSSEFDIAEIIQMVSCLQIPFLAFKFDLIFYLFISKW